MYVGLFAALIVVLAFFSRIWLVFAVFGLILSWIARCLLRKWKERKIPNWALAFFAVLGLVILEAVFTEFKSAHSNFTYTHEVPYTAILSYSSPLHVWQLHEEITVSKEKWIEFNHSPSGNETVISSPDILRARKSLIASDWAQTGMIGTADRFERIGEINVNTRWWAATTVNKVYTDILRGAAKEISDPIIPATDSFVVIQTPRYIIGATFPATDNRADILENKQERLTIPLKTTRLESREVRFEVLSPLLHWHWGPKIAMMSAFSGIEWFWLLIFGVFEKRISEGLIEPFVRRWIPGERSPMPDPDAP